MSFLLACGRRPCACGASYCTCDKRAATKNSSYEKADKVRVPVYRTFCQTVHGGMEYASDPSHYRLHVTIGRGSQDRATIYLGEHIPTNTQVAIRIVKLDLYREDFYHLQNEILAAKQLQNNNILPYLCTFVHKNEIWVVMPMMGFGSCNDLIHAHFAGGLPEAAIAYILRDVLHALDYLHVSGHIHRSIRASHVLISSEGHVCVTGLRASTSVWWEGKKLNVLHDLPQTSLISTNWLAPEVLQQDLLGYGTASDIYSVGILACELANGVVPFADMPPTQMLLEKVHGSQPQLIDSTTAMIEFEAEPSSNFDGAVTEDGEAGSRPAVAPVQRTFSQHFHTCVDRCLQRNPNDRPTAAQLLTHPFFKQIRRRSIDSLPQLLYPVAPLKNTANVPKDISIVDHLTEDMQMVRLDEECWAF